MDKLHKYNHNAIVTSLKHFLKITKWLVNTGKRNSINSKKTIDKIG